MYDNPIQEARRQVEICNACRYCEGYCSVFPAITSARAFSDGDITHLANLCHNCRGCYYACQYTDPHEFDLNLPKALAEVRHDSWKQNAWPVGFSALFDRAGVLIASLSVLVATVLFYAIANFDIGGGDGFYAYITHSVLVVIFAPVFLLPLFALGISLRSYWHAAGGGAISLSDLRAAFASAAQMKNLQGGHGDGCNFEAEDAFTPWRRWFHHFTLYGFLLCFASTLSGTVLHYVFDLQAPYGSFSLPKLLGVPGGIALCIGTLGLGYLKTKADPNLGAPRVWGGEMAFLVLLFGVSATGLALYSATGSALVSVLLPLHLGLVFVFFILTPYSKMAHGFYRMASLIQEAALRRAREQ